MRLRTICTLCLALFCSMLTMATTGELDSLRNLLPQAKGEERLQLMLKMCDNSFDAEPDLQESLIRQLIEECQHQGNKEAEAQAEIRLLCLYFNYGKSEQLRKTIVPFLDKTRKSELWTDYYYGWSLLTDNYFRSGKFFSALHEAKAMLDDAKKRDNKMGLASAYYSMGQTYNALHNRENALKNYQEAINTIRGEKEIFGVQYEFYYDYVSALCQYGMYDEMEKVCGEWKQILDDWMAYRKSKGVETLPITYNYLHYYSLLARLYVGKGDSKKAKAVLDEAEAMKQGAPLIAQSALDMGYEAYYASIFSYGKALEANQRLINTLIELNDSESLINAEARQAELLMKMGKKEQAADIFSRLQPLQDSINNSELRNQLNEMYVVNKLEREDAQEKQREAKRREITLFVIVLLLAALLVVLTYYFLSRRKMIKKLKQQKAELIDANERAKESSKMKESFIRHMNHEIRTPLNIINGFTQVLTGEDIDITSEERADIKQRMEKSSEEITALLNGMLELSKVDSIDHFDLNDEVTAQQLAIRAIDLSALIDNEKVHFSTIYEMSSDETFKTDREQATMVLECILSNAKKFTEKGHIELRCHRADEKIFFTVSDTGPGIPKDKREQIFKSFVKLDEFKEGIGIGLTLARLIAERLGGHLTLDEQYTGGSRFVFELPDRQTGLTVLY